MAKNTANIESRSAQREASKRATFELLRNKRRAEREITLELSGEDTTLLFRAIGAIEYDRLITKNPPNTDQKAEGSAYNLNTFGPDLLSHVCIEPELTKSEWSEIWNSSEWNRGEIMQIFLVAVELCNKGLDIPPTAED
jgi:hypothetical protein